MEGREGQGGGGSDGEGSSKGWKRQKKKNNWIKRKSQFEKQECWGYFTSSYGLNKYTVRE